MTLYHYTCEHAARALGYRGMLRPNAHPLLRNVRLVWLTDMDIPDRVGLGLTSDSLSCDRLNFRYVVDVSDAVRWLDWCRGRGDVGSLAVHLLESGGRQCHHWFVLERSTLGVRDRNYVNPCPLLVSA